MTGWHAASVSLNKSMVCVRSLLMHLPSMLYGFAVPALINYVSWVTISLKYQLHCIAVLKKFVVLVRKTASKVGIGHMAVKARYGFAGDRTQLHLPEAGCTLGTLLLAEQAEQRSKWSLRYSNE